MAKRLTRTVYVGGVGYGPTSVIPADVAVKITNPHVWADTADELVVVGVAEGPAGDVPVVPLPVPDAEATVKELREYAKSIDVKLGAAKNKEQILEVLGLAGPADAGLSTHGDPVAAGETSGGAEVDASDVGDSTESDDETEPAGDEQA